MSRKIKVTCPECKFSHTVAVPWQPTITTGIQGRKTPIGFEYTLTAPADVYEAGREVTIGSDLTLSGAVGVAVGLLAGFTLTPLVGLEYAPYAIGAGGSAGAMVAWGWLCAEYNTRLKRVLPWLLEQRRNWAAVAPPISMGVSLTVDHRYRDGTTESGRTVQYFGMLPVPVDKFNEWGRSVLSGDSLAIAQWTGSGKPFSRQEYDRLLDVMRRGGAVINVPGKGNQLTGGGRRALGRHLKQEGL